MNLQTKKLNFIQEILVLNNEKIIDKLGSVLKKERQKEAQKPSVYNLLGVMSEEEAEKMKKDIAQSCENINEDDWK